MFADQQVEVLQRNLPEDLGPQGLDSLQRLRRQLGRLRHGGGGFVVVEPSVQAHPQVISQPLEFRRNWPVQCGHGLIEAPIGDGVHRCGPSAGVVFAEALGQFGVDLGSHHGHGRKVLRIDRRQRPQDTLELDLCSDLGHLLFREETAVDGQARHSGQQAPVALQCKVRRDVQPEDREHARQGEEDRGVEGIHLPGLEVLDRRDLIHLLALEEPRCGQVGFL